MPTETPNVYGIAAQEIFELFADYLEGTATRPVLAISENALPQQAKTALESSFASFGFGEQPCTFATLAPQAEAESAVASQPDPGPNPDPAGQPDPGPNPDPASQPDPAPNLDPAALFMLIEGLDPLIVVSADSTATAQLAASYRDKLLFYAPLADNSEARLFGRPALTFADFPALLSTPESKQQAWSLLKTLRDR